MLIQCECGTIVQAGKGYSGSRLKCPECGGEVVAPSTPAAKEELVDLRMDVDEAPATLSADLLFPFAYTKKESEKSRPLERHDSPLEGLREDLAHLAATSHGYEATLLAERDFAQRNLAISEERRQRLAERLKICQEDLQAAVREHNRVRIELMEVRKALAEERSRCESLEKTLALAEEANAAGERRLRAERENSSAMIEELAGSLDVARQIIRCSAEEQERMKQEMENLRRERDQLRNMIEMRRTDAEETLIRIQEMEHEIARSGIASREREDELLREIETLRRENARLRDGLMKLIRAIKSRRLSPVATGSPSSESPSLTFTFEAAKQPVAYEPLPPPSVSAPEAAPPSSESSPRDAKAESAARSAEPLRIPTPKQSPHGSPLWAEEQEPVPPRRPASPPKRRSYLGIAAILALLALLLAYGFYLGTREPEDEASLESFFHASSQEERKGPGIRPSLRTIQIPSPPPPVQEKHSPPVPSPISLPAPAAP